MCFPCSKEADTLQSTYAHEKALGREESSPKVTVKSIKKVENSSGGTCGDLEREYQTSSENKDKPGRDVGDNH